MSCSVMWCLTQSSLPRPAGHSSGQIERVRLTACSMVGAHKCCAVVLLSQGLGVHLHGGSASLGAWWGLSGPQAIMRW